MKKLGLKYINTGLRESEGLPVINNGEWNKPSNFPMELGKIMTCAGIDVADAGSIALAYKYIPEGLLVCIAKRSGIRGKATKNLQAFWVFFPIGIEISSSVILNVIKDVENLFNDPLIFSNNDRFLKAIPSIFKHSFKNEKTIENQSGDMSGLNIAVVCTSSNLTLANIFEYGNQPSYKGFGLIVINQNGSNTTPVPTIDGSSFTKEIIIPDNEKETEIPESQVEEPQVQEVKEEEKVNPKEENKNVKQTVSPLPEERIYKTTRGEIKDQSNEKEIIDRRYKETNTDSLGRPNIKESGGNENPDSIYKSHSASINTEHSTDHKSSGATPPPFDPSMFESSGQTHEPEKSKKKNYFIIFPVMIILILTLILCFLFINNPSPSTKDADEYNESSEEYETMSAEDIPLDFPVGYSKWKGKIYEAEYNSYPIELSTSYRKGNFKNTLLTFTSLGESYNLDGIIQDDAVMFYEENSPQQVQIYLKRTPLGDLEGELFLIINNTKYNYPVSLTQSM